MSSTLPLDLRSPSYRRIQQSQRSCGAVSARNSWWGRNKGWFSGPIAAHAIETEQSPEYADGVKNGQRAVGYRVEGR
jgi:hypothetical protein